MDVFRKVNTKREDIVCGQNTEFVNVHASG